MTRSLTITSIKLKIVVDTNQFLSAFIYHGMMKSVFDLVFHKKLKLYISPVLKKEVLRKLREFEINNQTQKNVLSFIEARGILITPMVKIDVCRDKEDNFALELAESSHADYLVTRDKDLLDLHTWKNTTIMKPEDFLPLLRKVKLL